MTSKKTMAERQREGYPDIQRKTDELNKEFRELVKAAWASGFRIEVATNQAIVPVAPNDLANIHQVIRFRKRKHYG